MMVVIVWVIGGRAGRRSREGGAMEGEEGDNEVATFMTLFNYIHKFVSFFECR